MSLDDAEVFTAVVDAQSFTAAAKRLGIPKTTVSAKVARLEERLGVTLIRRTTRRLHVTAAGRSYHAHSVRALAEMSEAERELSAGSEEPDGVLRITVPADLAQSLLAPYVERYLNRYPKASVELIVSNQAMDLIVEGIDLAVRAGPLKDSSLVVHRFCSVRLALWASPAYLKRMGAPRTPAALRSHEVLCMSRLGPRITLKSAAGDTLRFERNGRIAADDFATLKSFVLRGNGIGMLPDFMGAREAGPAALIRVLPEYASEGSTIYFAYPAQRFVPPTVRAFISDSQQS